MTLRLPGSVAVDNRDHIISELRRRVTDLEEQLSRERGKNRSIDNGASELRNILSPLHEGLKRIFGELDDMGVGSVGASPTPDGRAAAIWEDWKRKFPGHPAKAIDALMLHGSLTQTQLRLHIGCATGTTSNVVSILNRAGLIVKNGGKISLKEV